MLGADAYAGVIGSMITGRSFGTLPMVLVTALP